MHYNKHTCICTYQCFHVFIIDTPIKHLAIFMDPLFIWWFWNHNKTRLHAPTNKQLGNRLVISQKGKKSSYHKQAHCCLYTTIFFRKKMLYSNLFFNFWCFPSNFFCHAGKGTNTNGSVKFLIHEMTTQTKVCIEFKFNKSLPTNIHNIK